MSLTMIATSLCEKIKTKGIELGERTSHLPLSFRLGDNQWVVVFRFGVVATAGLNEREREDVFSELKPFMENPHAVQKSEDISIELGGGVDEVGSEQARIQALTREHVLVMADILAKSVMLERYESVMSEVFSETEPIAEKLMTGFHRKVSSSALKRTIGATLMAQQNMIGRVEVHEKPEVLWEHPELEKFYARLEDEYEIKERNDALEKKLRLINTTAETQLGLLHNSHSLRVEWYIVILIVFEILLTLYEMFLKPVH
ncbi:RMD1 family protein [Seleniivibrio sp.]|uniref:RMD1 family protein n=1 Tax=Seleniivibrio sp. TaxID=2898801 RepID=UPI0025F1B6CF|nr:RMD1 family protein [Seleniivibrio sp.]MCD8554947.1 RMD1 family protein [Seleniivibrio sp.]